jgi:hypothetical protein
MFDRETWRQDHAAVVEEIRRLKKLRCASFQPGFGGREIYALLAHKQRATQMYLVRAAARGRVHPCSTPPTGSWEEKQRAKALEEMRAKYTKPDLEERTPGAEVSATV